jgi:hypothetical protein
VASKYGCRPSTLLDLSDPYTTYCFDEACAYILSRIEEGDTPVFKVHYKSFADMYKNYGK